MRAIALLMLAAASCDDLDVAIDPTPSWVYRVEDGPGGGSIPRICSTAENCRATEITCGDRTACAKLVSGQVACWGQSLRSFHTVYPESAPGGAHLRTIDLSHFLCGIDEHGGAACAGHDAGMLVGVRQYDDLGPFGVVLASPAIDVASGPEQACAVEADGAVECWGRLGRSFGEVPFGTEEPPLIPPLRIDGIRGRAVSVDHAVYGGGAAALLEDGTAVAWRFGDGTGEPRWETAAVVEGLSGARQITVGSDGRPMCAVLEDGTVTCRGLVTHPDGSSEERFDLVEGITGAVQIATPHDLLPFGGGPTPRGGGPGPGPGPDGGGGESLGCAVLETGRVRCWGQLDRLGLPADAGTPADVEGIEGAAEVCLENSYAMTGCVRLRDGRVRCWGDVYGTGERAGASVVEGLE